MRSVWRPVQRRSLPGGVRLPARPAEAAAPSGWQGALGRSEATANAARELSIGRGVLRTPGVHASREKDFRWTRILNPVFISVQPSARC
jgi:hypothetical protein